MCNKCWKRIQSFFRRVIMEPSGLAVLVVLFSSLVPSQGTGEKCPTKPGVDNVHTPNDRCYWLLSNHTMNFFDSFVFCQDNGGTLAMPKNHTTSRILSGLLKGRHSLDKQVWIGLIERPNDNDSHWIDGAPVAYPDFDSGEMKSDPKQLTCAVISSGSSRKWRRQECYDSKLPFICEFSLSKTSTPPKTVATATTTTPKISAPLDIVTPTLPDTDESAAVTASDASPTNSPTPTRIDMDPDILVWVGNRTDQNETTASPSTQTQPTTPTTSRATEDPCRMHFCRLSCEEFEYDEVAECYICQCKV